MKKIGILCLVIITAGQLYGGDPQHVVAGDATYYIWHLLTGPILYLVAGIIALITVWFWIRGKKESAFYGLGAFMLLAVGKALAELYLNMNDSTTSLLTTAPPVFARGTPELESFAYMIGTVTGYLRTGANICSSIYASDLFKVMLAIMLIAGTWKVAYEMVKGQDSGIGKLMAHLIIFLIVFGIMVFPVVRYNDGKLNNGTDWGGYQDEINESIAGVFDPNFSGNSSHVPLFPAFIMEAAKGVSEEFAIALLGTNAKDIVDNSVVKQSARDALHNASISDTSAMLYGKYATVCMAATKRLFMMDRTIVSPRAGLNSFQEVPIRSKLTSHPAGAVMIENMARAKSIGGYLEESRYAKHSLLSPLFLRIGQYLDVSGLLTHQGYEAQRASFYTKWGVKEVEEGHWMSSIYTPASREYEWDPGVKISKGARTPHERKGKDGDPVRIEYTVSAGKNSMDTGIFAVLNSYGWGDAWSNMPDPYLASALKVKDVHARAVCYVNYSLDDLTNMNFMHHTGVAFARNIPTANTPGMGMITSDYTTGITSVMADNAGLSVIPFVGTWNIPQLGVDNDDRLSGVVYNYDLSLAVAAAAWKGLNRTTCTHAYESGPKDRNFLGCYLLNVSRFTNASHTATAAFRDNIPDAWNLLSLGLDHWLPLRTMLFDCNGGSRANELDRIFYQSGAHLGRTPPLNDPPNANYNIFSWFSGVRDDSTMGTVNACSYSDLPKVRAYAALMSLMPRSREVIKRQLNLGSRGESTEMTSWLGNFWSMEDGLLSMLQSLMSVMVILIRALLGHVIGVALLLLLALFPLVPLFAMYPGKWVAALSWSRSAIWVYMWAPFFILGTVVTAAATVWPGEIGIDRLVGDVEGRYSILGEFAVTLVGLGLVVGAPSISNVVFRAADNGFEQVANAAYGSIMKVFGSGMTMMAMTASRSVVGTITGDPVAGGAGAGMAAGAAAASAGGQAATSSSSLGEARAATSGAGGINQLTDFSRIRHSDAGAPSSASALAVQKSGLTSALGPGVAQSATAAGSSMLSDRDRNPGYARTIGDIAPHKDLSHHSVLSGDALAMKADGLQDRFHAVMQGRAGSSAVGAVSQDLMSLRDEIDQAEKDQLPGSIGAKQLDVLAAKVDAQYGLLTGDEVGFAQGRDRLQGRADEAVMASQNALRDDDVKAAIQYQMEAATLYEETAQLDMANADRKGFDKNAEMAMAQYQMALNNNEELGDKGGFARSVMIGGRMDQLDLVQGGVGGNLQRIMNRAGSDLSMTGSERSQLQATSEAYEMFMRGDVDGKNLEKISDHLESVGLSELSALIREDDKRGLQELDKWFNNNRGGRFA